MEHLSREAIKAWTDVHYHNCLSGKGLYTISGLDWTTGLLLELTVQYYISILGLTGVIA